jgi:hypothetical protein
MVIHEQARTCRAGSGRLRGAEAAGLPRQPPGWRRAAAWGEIVCASGISLRAAG